jgi:hypothetical protein
MAHLIIALVVGFFVGMAAMWFLVARGQVNTPKK